MAIAVTRYLMSVSMFVLQHCSLNASDSKRVHTSDRRSLTGASLSAETSGCPGEESRLKAGCSQDWLPHKRPIDNRPQVGNLPHKARGFLGSVNAARKSACATE